jgi:hypothetical protein
LESSSRDEHNYIVTFIYDHFREDDSCALCQMVFEEVFSVLNDSTNVHEIQNVLDTVCYRSLPESLSNECEKLVAEFTAPVVQMIVHAANPDLICSGIKLCKQPQLTGV